MSGDRAVRAQRRPRLDRAPDIVASLPCKVCAADAVRTLGRFPYCEACADDVLDGIRESLRARGVMQGWGARCGRERPDLGPGMADLRCTDESCLATWVGRHGDPCGWCERRLELLREGQAKLLLNPVLPDGDDARHDGAVKAWGERLARGVEAELISEQQALTAWRREVAREHAA